MPSKKHLTTTQIVQLYQQNFNIIELYKYTYEHRAQSHKNDPNLVTYISLLNSRTIHSQKEADYIKNWSQRVKNKEEKLCQKEILQLPIVLEILKKEKQQIMSFVKFIKRIEYPQCQKIQEKLLAILNQLKKNIQKVIKSCHHLPYLKSHKNCLSNYFLTQGNEPTADQDPSCNIRETNISSNDCQYKQELTFGANSIQLSKKTKKDIKRLLTQAQVQEIRNSYADKYRTRFPPRIAKNKGQSFNEFTEVSKTDNTISQQFINTTQKNIENTKNKRSRTGKLSRFYVPHSQSKLSQSKPKNTSKMILSRDSHSRLTIGSSKDAIQRTSSKHRSGVRISFFGMNKMTDSPSKLQQIIEEFKRNSQNKKKSYLGHNQTNSSDDSRGRISQTGQKSSESSRSSSSSIASKNRLSVANNQGIFIKKRPTYRQSFVKTQATVVKQSKFKRRIGISIKPIQTQTPKQKQFYMAKPSSNLKKPNQRRNGRKPTFRPSNRDSQAQMNKYKRSSKQHLHRVWDSQMYCQQTQNVQGISCQKSKQRYSPLIRMPKKSVKKQVYTVDKSCVVSDFQKDIFLKGFHKQQQQTRDNQPQGAFISEMRHKYQGTARDELQLNMNLNFGWKIEELPVTKSNTPLKIQEDQNIFFAKMEMRCDVLGQSDL